MGKFLKLFGFVFILILFLFTVPNTARAASLINLSDQISTSRPSAASPLTADAASGVSQVSIVNNGSRYLASDSARILRTSSGSTIVGTKNVASQSAALTTTYLTSTLGAAAQGSTDVLVTAITAVHKIQFTTSTAVPASGHVVITFPGAALNTATPSATTFSFNGLASGNIKVTGATCGSWSISAPTIDCTLDASGIAASTTVAFYIGCTTVVSGACTVSVPTLINPTASSTMLSGSTSTADTWKVAVKTQDTVPNDLDSAATRIGTIYSIQVQADVEPTITFTIAGVNDATTISTLNSACTSNSDVTNTGINTTSVFVNLGVLASGAINKAAQTLTVSTNSSNGYTITATSSGHLINSANGFYLQDNEGIGGLTANDVPVPAVFPASGNTWFGIHACGTDAASVNTDQWTSASATSFSSGAKYANPWNTGGGSFADTLATYSGGPASARVTTVEYGATIGTTTPAGIYTTILTYIATATF